ncbi:MAG: hypothetical protein H6920_00295 [Sphingomonadaceae bacterium]|nr:hypothetical protein [Sphingomonadaceae bacterium]
MAELLAEGRGLLLRYEQLAEGAPEPLTSTLQEIIATRAPLLDDLAQAQRARGQLPPAGDHEINQIRATVDALTSVVWGEMNARQRLLQAEDAWLQQLSDDNGMAWSEAERALLRTLQRDAKATRECLAQDG